MYGEKNKRNPKEEVRYKKNEWNTEQDEEEGNTKPLLLLLLLILPQNKKIKCKILCEVTTYLNNKKQKRNGKTFF